VTCTTEKKAMLCSHVMRLCTHVTYIGEKKEQDEKKSPVTSHVTFHVTSHVDKWCHAAV
jgi:hypothetical protein